MMESKIVAFVVFSTGAGTLAVSRAYNCAVTRTADGDYDVSIGPSPVNGVGGIDSALCDIAANVTPPGAGGGAGTARILNVIHTSDTVKRVLIRDDAGAFALGAVAITFRRMPPLPAP